MLSVLTLISEILDDPLCDVLFAYFLRTHRRYTKVAQPRCDHPWLYFYFDNRAGVRCSDPPLLSFLSDELPSGAPADLEALFRVTPRLVLQMLVGGLGPVSASNLWGEYTKAVCALEGQLRDDLTDRYPLLGATVEESVALHSPMEAYARMHSRLIAVGLLRRAIHHYRDCIPEIGDRYPGLNWEEEEAAMLETLDKFLDYGKKQ